MMLCRDRQLTTISVLRLLLQYSLSTRSATLQYQNYDIKRFKQLKLS